MATEESALRVEMDSRKFMRGLEPWNIEDTSFRECIVTALLHLFLYRGNGSAIDDLAQEFEVQRSTVIRWAQGVERPHILEQRRIVAALHRELDLALMPAS